MAKGQYPVMLNRKNHRKIKLMSFEAEMPMGSAVDLLIQAVERRVEYAFEHDVSLDGIECPNLLVFLGLICVDIGIMSKDQFEKIAKDPNLHDAFLTAFDKGREYIDKIV